MPFLILENPPPLPNRRKPALQRRRPGVCGQLPGCGPRRPGPAAHQPAAWVGCLLLRLFPPLRHPGAQLLGHPGVQRLLQGPGRSLVLPGPGAAEVCGAVHRLQVRHLPLSQETPRRAPRPEAQAATVTRAAGPLRGVEPAAAAHGRLGERHQRWDVGGTQEHQQQPRAALVAARRPAAGGDDGLPLRHPPRAPAEGHPCGGLGRRGGPASHPCTHGVWRSQGCCRSAAEALPGCRRHDGGAVVVGGGADGFQERLSLRQACVVWRCGAASRWNRHCAQRTGGATRPRRAAMMTIWKQKTASCPLLSPFQGTLSPVSAPVMRLDAAHGSSLPADTVPCPALLTTQVSASPLASPAGASSLVPGRYNSPLCACWPTSCICCPARFGGVRCGWSGGSL
jgi:hypothetical protein